MFSKTMSGASTRVLVAVLFGILIQVFADSPAQASELEAYLVGDWEVTDVGRERSGVERVRPLDEGIWSFTKTPRKTPYQYREPRYILRIKTLNGSAEGHWYIQNPGTDLEMLKFYQPLLLDSEAWPIDTVQRTDEDNFSTGMNKARARRHFHRLQPRE